MLELGHNKQHPFKEHTMSDFLCEIQIDENHQTDLDFAQWVAFMEERDEDDLDRMWDEINDSISGEWNRIVWSSQEKPF